MSSSSEESEDEPDEETKEEEKEDEGDDNDDIDELAKNLVMFKNKPEKGGSRPSTPTDVSMASFAFLTCAHDTVSIQPLV